MPPAPPHASIPKVSELPLVIETPRLRLRPFTERDVDDLWPYVSDPALPRYMSWSAHTDRSETVAFVRDRTQAIANGSDVTWAIEHEGRASGSISLDSIRWSLRALRVDRAELGYWIAPPLWGQGLMTEAAHAVTRWGFDTLGLHKIMVGCLEANAGSRRVIEKVGFRFLCRMEEDMWRDGQWYAHLRYELTITEWSDVARTMRFSKPLQ